MLVDVTYAVVSFGAVYETSKLVNKARYHLGVTQGEFTLTGLVETEKYDYSSFTDVRVGGSSSYEGLTITALKSLKDDDYRLQMGLDIQF